MEKGEQKPRGLYSQAVPGGELQEQRSGDSKRKDENKSKSRRCKGKRGVMC